MRLLKGAFVVIEGVDGVGKTEQANLLAKEFNNGQDSLVTKTPGEMKSTGLVGCCIGPLVREAMFNPTKYPNICYESQSLMLLADHLQLVEEIVKPAVADNKIVICDRFMDSQFAAWGKDMSDPILQTFSRMYRYVPDITILLIGDPATCYYRASHRGIEDNKKQAAKAWNSVTGLQEIQDRYVALLDNHPTRAVIKIEVESKSVEQVHKEIFNKVKEWLERNHYTKKEYAEI